MKRRRKTVPRWQFDSILVLFVTLLLLVIVLVVTQLVEAKQDFLDPSGPPITIVERHHTRIVEKTVFDRPESVEALIEQLWGDEADNAKAVFKCESGLKDDARNANNRNGSVDRGTAQINSIHGIPEKWLADWRTNLTIAYQMWSEQGWRPWVCANKLGIK